MNRRAAGRAGGRPPRAARTVALGAVAGAVVSAVLGVPSPALATPAAPGTAAPATQSAPADSSERPLRVVLGRLEPRTVTPGAVVQVAGTLVNESDQTYRDLAVRLQRGDLLSTRGALAADLADPGDADSLATAFRPLDFDLAPGESQPFSFEVGADELQLPADGVYPLLVNVNATGDSGLTERAGELSTYLVAQPAQPVHRTTVAWLWPLTDRPHRDADGSFTDDDLAAEVARNGRLERAVRTLETVPQVPGDAPDGTRPTVPVTLAVDPALLEELSVMAAGRYTVDGRAGTGTADAAALLVRLKALATEFPVLALPYGDTDVDSLVAAGLGRAATRALPGTPDGTARQPVDADDTPATAPTTAEPTSGNGSGNGAGSGTDDGADTGAGAAIVRSVLGVQPRTDIAWPADGPVHADTLRTLQAGGVRSVVLGTDALTDAADATGQDGRPAAARAALTGTDGPLTALVADGQLAETVAGAAQTDDARVSEQRYLADLAVLTTQLADDDPATAQTVLVVPPRELDADPEWASAMMADTAGADGGQPWLQPAALADLVTGPEAAPVTATAPVTPGGLLPAEGTAQIARAEGVRDDVAGAVVGDPGTVLAGYDAAIARTASVAWRDDPDGFARAADDLATTLGRLQDEVTLVAPANGTYSLASSDAPLVLTVQNDLPFAVDVRLDLRTRGNVGLTTEDVGVTRLDPQSRTTLQVPAHVRQSGGFAVTARLQTPDGGALGAAVQLQVKSTAYGRVTVWVTVGAAALLGLLFLRRLVRFLLARRRGTPDTEPVDPASVPPTRSPV
ncbi:DUF6049 family protein [Modestobacter sp. NPDC049651]|uniref:DUF6049 family protein n=1 Tax=unclassified Modestobacter TaxID=2643866 RepID=UPI0033DCE920